MDNWKASLRRAVQQQQALTFIQALQQTPVSPEVKFIPFDDSDDFMRNFNRMLEAFYELNLIFRQSGSLASQAIKMLQVAHGFNYAFDAPWLLPVGKWIYTRLVQLCFDADRLALRPSQLPATKVKEACVPLDALRGKMQDRYPFPNTKKAGILYVLNLIFRCYLSFNNYSQMKKILQYVFNHVLTTPAEMIEKYFPRSEQATYYFYMGKFQLIQHNIPQAMEFLELALSRCHRSNAHNLRLIYMHLLTAKIISGRLPTAAGQEMDRYALTPIFSPLIQAIKRGDMISFIDALEGRQENRQFFMRHHLFNVLRWRCELLVWRNLIKRVFILGSSIADSGTHGYQTLTGSDSFIAEDAGGAAGMAVDSNLSSFTVASAGPPRISFKHISAAIRFSSQRHGGARLFDSSTTSTMASSLPTWQAFNWSASSDAENQLFESAFSLGTRLIESGLLKGYISPSSACIVISRKQPFPTPSEALARLMERERWWEPRSADRRIIDEKGNDEDDDDDED